jgi:dTDP-4-dehydrorhamnose reductase
MKISLIGRGTLGFEVEALLSGAGHQLRTFDFPDFDIRDEASLERACEGVDAVVNCAAFTAVDKAESEVELCRQVNALAPGALGRAAARRGVFVVHIGTDFVFDGSGARPWTEDDLPKPLNVYGATKLEGERALLASGCEAVVMRVQWTYGRNGANFAARLLELAKTRDTLKIVSDQIGAPTNAADMAKAIQVLLERRVKGLFHFAASGYCSRYECAKLVFDALGMKTSLIPCASSEFPAPAKRPLNSRLDCSKFERATGFARPGWKESLLAFVETHMKGVSAKGG